MAETQIPVGSALARKVFGGALFAAQLRKPTLAGNLTGPAPQQPAAQAKMKGQSSPDMPIVEVRSLEDSPGDTVSVDLFNIIGGKPVMGDNHIEGKGQALTFSSMDVKLNQYRQAVNAGGEMSRKRTVNDLRGIAMAALLSYFPRLRDQLALVQLAGARGAQGSVNGLDWVVPPQTDPDFATICVNAVRAPTFNRHFVVDAATIVAGGQQLGAIDSTDVMKLIHIDLLRQFIDDLEFPLQPVKIADDPAAEDEPMYVLLLSPRAYFQLVTDTTANGAIRAFQQNAWNRASYGSKSPLFRGEVGMWNGILVKKMTRSIRFNPGDSTQIITAANAATATESAQVVNAALGAGKAVDRGILLGAQALALVYGKHHKSGFYFNWNEKLLDHDNELEVAAAAMAGYSKTRFSIPDQATGTPTPTDHGVIVIDSAVAL